MRVDASGSVISSATGSSSTEGDTSLVATSSAGTSSGATSSGAAQSSGSGGLLSGTANAVSSTSADVTSTASATGTVTSGAAAPSTSAGGTTGTATVTTGSPIYDPWDTSSCPDSTDAAGGAAGASGGGATNGSAPKGPGSISTDPDLLVAFFGDQSTRPGAAAVLDLIREEGADAAVHLGDFDYTSSPDVWDGLVDQMLGPGYPYFALVGNWDAAAWDGAGGYAEKIAQRHARIPEMNCTGELGVKATCNFRGLYMVQSCIGVGELGSHCAQDSPEQLDFIRDALGNHDSVFSMCLWHKNQKDMQVGGKPDEVGWGAYRECMAAGAIVATGHEHSYARTRTLTDVGNPMNQHGVEGSFPTVELAAGKNFAFVSGLGGHSIRSFQVCTHHESTWWASYYSGNRWLKNGIRQTGAAQFGAAFIRFHVDGDPRKARGYFKDIDGVLADEFDIIVP